MFGIYAIPTTEHLLATFIHEVKLSMHRDMCGHYTYSICMKLDMLLSKNVVPSCEVLFANLVLCRPAVSRRQNSSLYREVKLDVSTYWNCFEIKRAGPSSVWFVVS